MSSDETVERPINNIFDLKFSEEERAILQKCSRDSFYERCLPLSIIFGLFTYYTVKTGYWQPSRRYGALPKIALAVGLAFYTGKLSYREICMERFMQSPNSEVGKFLREKFDRVLPKPNDKSEAPSNEQNDKTTPQNNPERAFSSLELDTFSKPSFSEDLSFQPTFPSTHQLPAECSTKNNKTESGNSYEDMRSKNREEYYNKRRAQLKKKQGTNNKPKTKPENKNQYGDIID